VNPIRPIDVVIMLMLRVATEHDRSRPVAWLASELAVSSRLPYESLQRLAELRLVRSDNTLVAPAFLTFIESAAPYVFPVSPGPIVGGMPTASSAAPLTDIFVATEGELAFVWPDAEGSLRGATVEPLHRSVPALARKHPQFYADIALVDGLRMQQPRIRREARKLLHGRLAEAN